MQSLSKCCCCCCCCGSEVEGFCFEGCARVCVDGQAIGGGGAPRKAAATACGPNDWRGGGRDGRQRTTCRIPQHRGRVRVRAGECRRVLAQSEERPRRMRVTPHSSNEQRPLLSRPAVVATPAACVSAPILCLCCPSCAARRRDPAPGRTRAATQGRPPRHRQRRVQCDDRARAGRRWR